MKLFDNLEVNPLRSYFVCNFIGHDYLQNVFAFLNVRCNAD